MKGKQSTSAWSESSSESSAEGDDKSAAKEHIQQVIDVARAHLRPLLLHLAGKTFEPSEAAEIVLTYKLEDRLSAGQIQSISHEMTDEKVAEQYADPSFHYDLFNINQLLFKAYKGKFPNTEASIIVLELSDANGGPIDVTNEILTKALSESLSERSIIKRLYEDQMEGTAAFGDADKIIWLYNSKGDNTYEVITSRYWIEKADIENGEYETEIKFFEGDD